MSDSDTTKKKEGIINGKFKLCRTVESRTPRDPDAGKRQRVQFVSAADYKHYYTFPKGTYLVNINLFANLEASTSNVLGVALNIEVDDKPIANPWFRMIDSYQSISYPVIISGSKLKVTMYSGKTIEIVNNINLSYIDFMRLN